MFTNTFSLKLTLTPIPKQTPRFNLTLTRSHPSFTHIYTYVHTQTP